HREVQAVIRPHDLSIAFGRRSNRESGGSGGKSVNKFTSCKHMPSQGKDGSLRLKVLNQNSQRTGIHQGLLHACPTLSSGFLRGCRSMPVSFKTHSLMEAGIFQRSELSCPIDHTSTDGSPHHFARIVLFSILDVAMVNTIFGQHLPS